MNPYNPFPHFSLPANYKLPTLTKFPLLFRSWHFPHTTVSLLLELNKISRPELTFEQQVLDLEERAKTYHQELRALGARHSRRRARDLVLAEAEADIDFQLHFYSMVFEFRRRSISTTTAITTAIEAQKAGISIGSPQWRAAYARNFKRNCMKFTPEFCEEFNRKNIVTRNRSHGRRRR